MLALFTCIKVRANILQLQETSTFLLQYNTSGFIQQVQYLSEDSNLPD